MDSNRNTCYEKLVLPEDLLTSLAKAMTPEIRKFYESEPRDHPNICVNLNDGVE